MDKSAPATPEKIPIGYGHVSASAVPRLDSPKYPSNSGDVTIVLSMDFVKSVAGILKVIQMVFGLVTFICATVGSNKWWYREWYENGSTVWVQIASMTTFLLTAILYVLHAFKITSKFPGKVPFKFIELVFYLLSALCYLTCGIVCCVFNYHAAGIIAAAFFSYANMLLYGAEIYVRYLAWWRSEEGPYCCGKKPLFLPTSSGSSAASRAVTETLY